MRSRGDATTGNTCEDSTPRAALARRGSAIATPTVQAGIVAQLFPDVCGWPVPQSLDVAPATTPSELVALGANMWWGSAWLHALVAPRSLTEGISRVNTIVRSHRPARMGSPVRVCGSRLAACSTRLHEVWMKGSSDKLATTAATLYGGRGTLPTHPLRRSAETSRIGCGGGQDELGEHQLHEAAGAFGTRRSAHGDVGEASSRRR